MSKIVLILVLCLCMGCADAASVSYTATAPLQQTYWSQILTLPQFDSALGTLDSVTLRFTGRVEGSASFESLDADPTTVKMTLGAILTLLRPDSSVILAVSPAASTTDTVSAYDGTMDLTGTSGKTYSGLWATDAQSLYLDAVTNDLSPYIGGGNLSMTATAKGNSFGSGAGNLVLLFRASASAVAQVTYEYTQVPEPSSLAMISLGALSLAGLIRRNRR